MTVSQEAEGQTQTAEEPYARLNAQTVRAGARTARSVAQTVTVRVLTWLRAAWAGITRWWSHEKTAAEKAAPDPLRSSLWSQAPASPAEVLAYTRSGAWAPGDRAAPIELAGKAYGYGVALPATVMLYAAAWTLQRPTRLAAVVGFLVLLVASWGT